jgi:hypothetical protein
MIDFSKLYEKIANQIMDCRHKKKIENCAKCINYKTCTLTNTLRTYEMREKYQNEHFLGY